MHLHLALRLSMVAVLCLAGTACSNADGPGAVDGDASASSDGALVIAIGGDESSLNPYTYVKGYPGYNLMMLAHDSLLQLDEDNVPQAALATDVEVSEDGLTHTLTLRDDVTWHDGQAFDADDVVFTFDYVAANTHPRWTPGVASVASVTASSPTEVVVELTDPNADFLVRPLADMPILAEHVWSGVDDPLTSGEEVNIGTGPYRFVSYTVDQSYAFEANPDYALGTPRLSTIDLAVIPEPATAFAALRAGEVDMVASPVEPQLIDQFTADPGLDLQTGPGFGSTLLNMDTQAPGLDVLEVRQAVSRAVDPQELIDVVLLGGGTAPNPGFLHPDGPITVDPLTHVHDPSEAVLLLERAGASLGADGVRVLDGQRLSFDLLVDASEPGLVRAAEILTEQLAEVGIGVQVAPRESATVEEAVWPGFDVANGQDYELAMWGWTAPVQLDAARFGSLFHSDPAVGTFNVTGLVDPDIDALIDRTASAPDAATRDPLIAAVQQRAAEVVPFVTLYYDDGTYAYRPETFDGWTYQAGQGLLSKLSLVEPDDAQ